MSTTTPTRPSDVSALLAGTPLVDGHNDLPHKLRELNSYDLTALPLDQHQTRLRTDIPRLRRGLVGAQFWSAYVPCELSAEEAVAATLRQVSFIRHLPVAYPDTFALAETAADVWAIHKRGRIASLIGLEGGHSIGNSPAVLDSMYRLGARYMTLTHTSNTDWADSATDEPRHDGLSTFGEQLVRQMNRLGMLVDLSHVAVKTMNDALDISAAPVIFSHSACSALCPVSRNVPDEVLARLPGNGGVLMVAFVPGFLSPARACWQTTGGADTTPAPEVTVADVADHIDHAREVAGVDHIGLGSDFDGCAAHPTGLDDVSCFPNLLAELRDRGYSGPDLRKVAGGNVLRALDGAELVARGRS